MATMSRSLMCARTIQVVYTASVVVGAMVFMLQIKCDAAAAAADPLAPDLREAPLPGTSTAPINTTTRTTAIVTATTTTTTTGAFGSCTKMARCLNDTNCGQCLRAINATAPHSMLAYYADGSEDTESPTLWTATYDAMVSTPSCAPNATQPGMIIAAMIEITDNDPNTPVTLECTASFGMRLPSCALYGLYTCFLDADCHRCLTAALHRGSTESKADVLDSPTCTTPSGAFALANYIGTSCHVLYCSLQKHLCKNSPSCMAALAALNNGDGVEAARVYMNQTLYQWTILSVVDDCAPRSTTDCDFARAFCAGTKYCGACLDDITNAVDQTNSRAIAAAFGTSASCRVALRALQPNNPNGSLSIDSSLYALHAYASSCPTDSSACLSAVVNMARKYGDKVLSCINGSTHPIDTEFCNSETLKRYDLDTSCQPCPRSVHVVNYIVIATAAVGGASTVVCLGVVATIFAHGHDRASTRDRIIAGLMLSNAIYSSANAIPINGLLTGVTTCGQLMMSFEAIRFGRAWWFCGKYGLVSFELFIVAASIRVLSNGASSQRSMSRWAEGAAHVACAAVAVAAFSVFYFLCESINDNGYNSVAETQAASFSSDHTSLDDDADDYGVADTTRRFDAGRAAFDNLVREMLIAWDVLVGVAVVLWLVLRLLYWRLLVQLRNDTVAATQAEAEDEWAATRHSAWEAQLQLLKAREDAFSDVAKPLEPYIAIFVVFAAPAIVMSTAFCRARSGEQLAFAANSAQLSSGAIGYGSCDVWCECILAFRSIGTVCVYLLARERRIEVMDVRGTCRKLVDRVFGCLDRDRTTPRFAPLHDEFCSDDKVELVQRDAADDDAEDSTNGPISEGDFTRVRRLGEGGFGEVWEAELGTNGRKVAIKILFAAAVDEDGDRVNPQADEDFNKECSALKRIDSPHLLKFYGFGTTEGGNGFIVTELMSGGSLEDVLRDSKRDLQWRMRVSIGLQVALGMDYLSHKHMTHRDLKSANVLLDDKLMKAKVCDFGLTRVVRPVHPRAVHSPFTGVTRLLPMESSVEVNFVAQSATSMSNIAVSIVDVRGTMTKAAGTLLWMAPEVFRGDQHYTKAVDVYSFGIVLWELATRKVPWVDDLSSDHAAFFEGLNLALQKGRRPSIPDAVSTRHAAFVAVMKQCWAGDPVDRPSFSEASRDLAAILNTQTHRLS
jgi:serine/threonine protein kinase